MADYKKMYMVLFNGITNALGDLQRQNFGFAKFTLTEAQQRAEELYIQTAEDEQPA